MRHVPFFRWVLTAGVVLFACAVGLYATGSGMPDVRQIDLTVLDEKPDGSCTVQWNDPYRHRTREASYRCDPTRADVLKAPRYDGSDQGWDTGYMITEGPRRGNLWNLSTDDTPSRPEVLLMLGTPLIAVGLVGGNLRALPRVLGVQGRLVRRATGLSEAAHRVAEEYERAVAAVRDASRLESLPQEADGGLGSRLVTSLWILREAGPEAGEIAAAGRELADRLHGPLEAAAPAAGLRTMLQIGPAARSRATAAVAELRSLLAYADENNLPERFTQTSVDLLRGHDVPDFVALAAGADFARHPAAYRHLLSELTAPAVPPRAKKSPRRIRWWRRRR
ncbi:hypothetical protein [Streptomyces sp. KAU_LT]|uniref:hypothetical protein n=1 Tax=unclassified Streptomyces TaxID=2593676 RepID=UPI0024B72379|nr:hypothetical protein [Streptomyces sp. KAU_LT]MDI9832779.1 hypothetical protein [Streptomyces sp. KAU_LT]